MKKFLVLVALYAFAAGVYAFPSFDPLANSLPSGTDYAVNGNLVGQTNALGDRWVGINTTGAASQPFLANYTFGTYNNLPAPSGTVAAVVNAAASGQGARMDISSTGISNGTVYASMLLKCPVIDSLSASTTGLLGGGVFNMAFGDTSGLLTNQPSILGGRWYFRKSANDSTKYNIGISKVRTSGGGANPTAYWDSRDFATSDELFVVVGYKFNTATTNDDVIKLWINPDPATLGGSTEATPSATNPDPTIDTDLTMIKSFNIMVRNAAQVTQMYIDEIRLGTNWAQVTAQLTAPVVIPTLTISQQDASTVLLSWSTNSANFTLQSVTQLLSSGTPWAAVGGSPTVSGSNYIQSDSISPTSPKFYRLLH
jgi:hypothetical protein